MTERTRDLAHIGSIELFTPVLEDSRDFFVRQMGLEEVGRTSTSVDLHAWDDYEAVTVRLVARDRAGIGRTFLRASGPEALARRVSAIEASGRGEGWSSDEPGLGPVYLFTDPDGHGMGVYWESDRHVPARAPALKNQASPFPGRGANVRRLDHVNYLNCSVPDCGAFLRDVLGARPTERIQLDDGSVTGDWYSISDKSYDLVNTVDRAGAGGRLHHVAFATDTREDILRAADVFLEHGTFIETGPHKHAIQQTFFLYVYEPGGNRIELCNAGARLLLQPDWEPVVWTAAERARGQAWGLQTIASFHTHGTPPADVAP